MSIGIIWDGNVINWCIIVNSLGILQSVIFYVGKTLCTENYACSPRYEFSNNGLGNKTIFFLINSNPAYSLTLIKKYYSLSSYDTENYPKIPLLKACINLRCFPFFCCLCVECAILAIGTVYTHNIRCFYEYWFRHSIDFIRNINTPSWLISTHNTPPSQ